MGNTSFGPEYAITVIDPVTDQKFILDWLKNMDRDIFNIIKEKLEENKNKWQYPDQPVKCGNCSTDGTIKPVLDQSNFFV